MKRTIAHLTIALCVAGVAHADQTIHSVQQALKEKGFYYGNVTGDKSAETTAAIRRYQIRSGLQVTGEINPETLQSLNLKGNATSVASSQAVSKPAVAQSNNVPSNNNSKGEQNSPQPSSTQLNHQQPAANPAYSSAYYQLPPSRRSQRTAVAELQRQLTARGYYQGHADGNYGRRTALALRAFQTDSGLPPTGQLDTTTLQTLGLSNSNLAYSPPESRSYENRVPIWKFKHGQWKLKWKKYHGNEGGEYGDQNRPEHAEAWWNGFNEDY